MQVINRLRQATSLTSNPYRESTNGSETGHGMHRRIDSHVSPVEIKKIKQK